MINILFVCLGNICRSPLAEALFNHKIKQLHWLDKFSVDSCGTGDFHIGAQPDPRTIKSAHHNGVEIFHACRQLITSDLQNFDYIMAMDKSNRQNIFRLADPSSFHDRILLMRDFDSLHPGSDVPDPYHGNEREFNEVFSILDRSMDGFINHLKGISKNSLYPSLFEKGEGLRS